MKLSVCIITYNHSAFLRETIENVLSQKTSFDFEIVISDDCSTDGARQILQEYQTKFPGKIRVLFNPVNLGMMHNNAQGMLNCRGEYIALLDGDDYWISNEKLQKQVEFLDSAPDFSFCFHDAKILGIGAVVEPWTCCGHMQKKIIGVPDIVCDTHIPTCSIVFRRAALAGYPPKNFMELNASDRPLFLFLASKGLGYYFDECWGMYRRHANGHWTSQPHESRWLTHLQIYRVMNKILHFKYKTAFCRCEVRVTFELALLLIKDGKRKRAQCYFRKFRRLHSPLAMLHPRFLSGAFKYYKYKYFTNRRLRIG